MKVKNEEITIETLKVRPYILNVWAMEDDDDYMEENRQAYATLKEVIEQAKKYMGSIDDKYEFSIEVYTEVVYDLKKGCIDFKKCDPEISEDIEWWKVVKFEDLPTDKQTLKEFGYLWNNEATRQRAERKRYLDFYRENCQ